MGSKALKVQLYINERAAKNRKILSNYEIAAMKEFFSIFSDFLPFSTKKMLLSKHYIFIKKNRKQNGEFFHFLFSYANIIRVVHNNLQLPLKKYTFPIRYVYFHSHQITTEKLLRIAEKILCEVSERVKIQWKLFVLQIWTNFRMKILQKVKQFLPQKKVS